MSSLFNIKAIVGFTDFKEFLFFLVYKQVRFPLVNTPKEIDEGFAKPRAIVIPYPDTGSPNPHTAFK